MKKQKFFNKSLVKGIFIGVGITVAAAVVKALTTKEEPIYEDDLEMIDVTEEESTDTENNE